MDEGKAEVGIHRLAQSAKRGLRVLDRQCVGLADEGVHEIGLPSLVDLLPHPSVDLLLVALPGEVRDDPSSWPAGIVADGGNIQVAESRQGEGTGNRGGCHEQEIRLLPFSHDRHALQHAELVLLVHDHEPEAARKRRLREQGVSAEEDVDLASL